MSYLIADGLALYFKEKLCEDIKNSEGSFTIQFDETAKSKVEKQCDILVRYWSDTENLVRVRFLKAVMFGHAKGADVAKELINTLQEPGYQLPLAKLISITSDGPNVNKTIWHNVNEWTKEAGYHGPLPLMPCNLHVVHNSFRKGLNAYGEDAEQLCLDLFYWFKLSPCKREDFRDIVEKLDFEEINFVRHVQSRWLTLLPAVERVLKNYSAVKKYFLEEIPKQKEKMVLNNDGKGMLSQLSFLESVTPLYNKFLGLFESEEPLIHLTS